MINYFNLVILNSVDSLCAQQLKISNAKSPFQIAAKRYYKNPDLLLNTRPPKLIKHYAPNSQQLSSYLRQSINFK